MERTWRRLAGSVAFALVGTVLVFWRDIFSAQLDLGGLAAGLVAGTLIGYRAWPALEFARWRR